MRLAVAATAPLGATVLEGLAERHDVELLLTRPDRPRGRGRRMAPPPAKEAAERLGIRVVQPERLDRAPDRCAAPWSCAAYGALVPDELLEERLWLNVHPSLLPRWRGAAPVERALMAGDAETGVTIHRTTAELDAGPIAAQRAFAVGPEDDAGTVYDRAGRLAVELLDEALPEPALHAAARRGRHVRGEDHAPPTASSTGAARRGARRTVCGRCRRTSARGARSTGGGWSSGARGPQGPGRARRGPSRAPRGAAGGAEADDGRRVPPRPAVTALPSRPSRSAPGGTSSSALPWRFRHDP